VCSSGTDFETEGARGGGIELEGRTDQQAFRYGVIAAGASSAFSKDHIEQETGFIRLRAEWRGDGQCRSGSEVETARQYGNGGTSLERGVCREPVAVTELGAQVEVEHRQVDSSASRNACLRAAGIRVGGGGRCCGTGGGSSRVSVDLIDCGSAAADVRNRGSEFEKQARLRSRESMRVLNEQRELPAVGGCLLESVEEIGRGGGLRRLGRSITIDALPEGVEFESEAAYQIELEGRTDQQAFRDGVIAAEGRAGGDGRTGLAGGEGIGKGNTGGEAEVRLNLR
jgi:hypothetical protein